MLSYARQRQDDDEPGPFSLGHRVFDNKTAIKQYLNREFLISVPPGDEVPAEARDVLLELITHHYRYEEKLAGSTFVKFTVMEVEPHQIQRLSLAGQRRRQKCFCVHRADGTMTDFSVNKCVDALQPDRKPSASVPYPCPPNKANMPKTSTVAAKAASGTDANLLTVKDPADGDDNKEALVRKLHVKYVRKALYGCVDAATQYLMQAHRKREFDRADDMGIDVLCKYTGTVVFRRSANVVFNPPMEQLQQEWADSEGIQLAELQLKHADNAFGEKLVDSALETSWKRYFSKHYCLWIVSDEGRKMLEIEHELQGLIL